MNYCSNSICYFDNLSPVGITGVPRNDYEVTVKGYLKIFKFGEGKKVMSVFYVLQIIISFTFFFIELYVLSKVPYFKVIYKTKCLLVTDILRKVNK